jgi:hypothetical protein
MDTFSASIDSYSRNVTIEGFFVYLAPIILILIVVFAPPPKNWKRFLYIVTVFIIIVCGSSNVFDYLHSIKSYQVTVTSLIIKRPFERFDVEFPLSEIKKVELLNDTTMQRTTRIVGNDGSFGYTGSYLNPNIGHFTMYATQHKNRVLIVLNKEKIIISPDDTGMVHVLNKECKKVP